MFKNIYAEIIKLMHKKIFWIIHIIMLLIIMYSYYMKAYDVSSGYFQPEVINCQYMMIFNLCTLSLFSFFYSVIIFGLISAQDYESNCMSYILLRHKRLYYNIYKIATGVVIVLINGLIFIVVGFFQGFLHNGSIDKLNFIGLISAFFSYILICILYGIASYLLCFIFKNATLGIISSIIFTILKNYFIQDLFILVMIKKHSNNLLFYGFNLINQLGDKQIILATKKPLYNYNWSVLFILLYSFIIFIIIEIIAKYRDCDS